ncbi:MAG: hypothetical protein M0R46_12620 [Candidatus Muirbacterium halophilum]|nr:hypothetical protein [Candidatus Muirbacterium halophilum]
MKNKIKYVIYKGSYIKKLLCLKNMYNHNCYLDNDINIKLDDIEDNMFYRCHLVNMSDYEESYDIIKKLDIISDNYILQQEKNISIINELYEHIGNIKNKINDDEIIYELNKDEFNKQINNILNEK